MRIRLGKADAVRSFLEEVSLYGNTLLLKSDAKIKASSCGNVMVLHGMPDKYGRSIVANGALARKRAAKLGRGIVAKQTASGESVSVLEHGDYSIAENSAVGTGGYCIDLVKLGTGLACIEMLDGACCKVSACGEAHNGDLIGINVELGSVVAHVSDGAQNVAQLYGMLIGVNAVIEYEGVYACLVYLLSDRASLVLCTSEICSAGTDDNASAYVISLAEIRSDGGFSLTVRGFKIGGSAFPKFVIHDVFYLSKNRIFII